MFRVILMARQVWYFNQKLPVWINAFESSKLILCRRLLPGKCNFSLFFGVFHRIMRYFIWSILVCMKMYIIDTRPEKFNYRNGRTCVIWMWRCVFCYCFVWYEVGKKLIKFRFVKFDYNPVQDRRSFFTLEFIQNFV